MKSILKLMVVTCALFLVSCGEKPKVFEENMRVVSKSEDHRHKDKYKYWYRVGVGVSSFFYYTNDDLKVGDFLKLKPE